MTKQDSEKTALLDMMKDQYVIIDFRNMDFMKNKEGKINYYNTLDEACEVCGMYEFQNAWVMKLIYNHIEGE
jgi:hypothetical protein